MNKTNKYEYIEDIKSLEQRLFHSFFYEEANEERKEILKDYEVKTEDIIILSNRVNKKLMEVKEHLPLYLALYCYNRIFQGRDEIEVYRKHYEITKEFEDLDFDTNIETMARLLPNGVSTIDTKLAYLLTEYTGREKVLTCEMMGVEHNHYVFYTIETELQEELRGIIVEMIKNELRRDKKFMFFSEMDISVISKMLYEDIKDLSRVEYLYDVKSVLTIDNYRGKTLRYIRDNTDMKKFNSIF